MALPRFSLKPGRKVLTHRLAQVGIAEADGKIDVNHSAYNAGDSSAAATFSATSVTKYEGGAFADADMAQVGQEVGIGADVFAQAMAENGVGYTASVTFEGNRVLDLEQQAFATVYLLAG